MRVFDSHVHLDEFPSADAARSVKAADYRALVPGIEPTRTRNTLDGPPIPGALFAAALHPWYLPDSDDESRWAAIVELAEDPRIVAIGETGLDHYRFREAADRERVARWFTRHVELAARVDKPLVIHCVRAHADCLRLLHDIGAPVRGVVHAFSGSAEEADAYWRTGFRVGIGSAVTRERSSRVRAAAAAVPDAQLLVETDAPYLAADGGERGLGSADDILHVIRSVAELRGTTPEVIAELTWANASQLFGTGGGG